MSVFYHDNKESQLFTFDAMKEQILFNLQPIMRQLKRNVNNGLPITQGQLADIQAQVDNLEQWLRKLRMGNPPGQIPGRRAIARATRQITHSPGDANYSIEPPAKKKP